MPKQKPKVPKKSAKYLAATAEEADLNKSRHPVSFVLDTPENTRIVSECRQIEQASGMPDLTVGRYAKHALLTHRRLRSIETQLRSWLSVLTDGRDIDASIPNRLRAILETPVAG